MSYQFTSNLPNVLSQNGAGQGASDFFSDLFLGTDNIGQKQKLQMMNEANRFNEYMDNTKYQRMMADMNAAGLNPMVMASGGNLNATAAPQSATQNASSNKSGGILGKELANFVNQFAKTVSGEAQSEKTMKALSAVSGK